MDQSKLSELQNLILDQLLVLLKDPETCTPGMIQAALRFLADNEIESLPKAGDRLNELKDSLPFPQKRGTA